MCLALKKNRVGAIFANKMPRMVQKCPSNGQTTTSHSKPNLVRTRKPPFLFQKTTPIFTKLYQNLHPTPNLTKKNPSKIWVFSKIPGALW